MCMRQNITIKERVDLFMYEKLLWINPNIQYMFHSNIVEYDMRAMSVSISERYNLLDSETIALLKLMPKEERTKKVGLLQRDNKDYSNRLIECELETRRKFLEINNIQEDDVLSLHSDACIFKSTKEIINNIEGVEFKHANTWSAYMNYRGIEMFYDNGVIDYKGIPKQMLGQHTLGVHSYLLNVFNKIENYDSDILDFLAKFESKYLQYRLPDQYYLPFGKMGEYQMTNLSLFGFIAKVVLSEMRGW